jgi:hypothetical protein
LALPGQNSADQLFFHKPLLFGNQEALLRRSLSSPPPRSHTSAPVPCTKTATDIDEGTEVEYLLVLRGSGRAVPDYLLEIGEVFTERHTLLGSIYFLYSARVDTGRLNSDENKCDFEAYMESVSRDCKGDR